MSKMTKLISANKAYNLAYLENKSRLYQNIESAARCGDMYYDTDCASITDDTIAELKNAGYEISPAGAYTRISWKQSKNATNQ